MLEEFDLIKNLLANLGEQKLDQAWLAAGDDCAVVPESDGSYLLLSSDLMVEDVHFRRSYFSPEDLARKLLAVNVSDVLAMGGAPEFVLINLQIPKNFDLAYLRRFYGELGSALKEYGVVLLGGDTSSAKSFALSLTIVGRSKFSPILRSGAKPGDDLWLSSAVGYAGLGLALLEGKLVVDNLELRARALTAHLRPKLSPCLAQKLSVQGLANCMIDVSDGLLQDAMHLAEASKCSFDFDLGKIPICHVPAVWSEERSLSSGEDYALLFSASAANREQIIALKELAPELSLVGSVCEQSAACAEIFLKVGDRKIFAEEYVGTGLGYRHKF